MKLSTQMLKRAWDDDAPGFNERIARYTQNLIEQIDSLSHIATEFSNFAKMPNMVKEKVDIHSLLLNAIDLHQGEQGVNITLDVDVNALPCEDACIDIALASQVYEYVETIDAALRELARVIRPGGRAVLVDTDWESAVWASHDDVRMRSAPGTAVCRLNKITENRAICRDFIGNWSNSDNFKPAVHINRNLAAQIFCRLLRIYLPIKTIARVLPIINTC
jgi:SAM-dependent methyltransferase